MDADGEDKARLYSPNLTRQFSKGGRVSNSMHCRTVPVSPRARGACRPAPKPGHIYGLNLYSPPTHALLLVQRQNPNDTIGKLGGRLRADSLGAGASGRGRSPLA